MAHEIGHVLLGTTEHCRGGIMKATWSKTDFQVSQRATAEFTAGQYAAIRTRISIQAAVRARK
jgi:Zn-dependent peptidase ImmA (M78 family)